MVKSKIMKQIFSIKKRKIAEHELKVLTLFGIRFLLSLRVLAEVSVESPENRVSIVSSEDSSIAVDKTVKPIFSSADKALDFYKGSLVKLHIGCGNVYKEGWINIDNNEYHNIKKLDLEFDLVNPLPFPDNSVDYIFNEHFLEHLTVEDGKKAIVEFMRVLKPRGVLRIAMPDLKSSVAHYTKSKEQWLADTKELYEKHHLTYIKTQAEMLNIAFREWGHKWLYDKEELARRIEEAGFKNYVFCSLRESSHDELNNLETRNESVLIAEVIKGE